MSAALALEGHRPRRYPEFGQHGYDFVEARVVLGVAGHDVMDGCCGVQQRSDPPTDEIRPWPHRTDGVLDVDEQYAVICLHRVIMPGLDERVGRTAGPDADASPGTNAAAPQPVWPSTATLGQARRIDGRARSPAATAGSARRLTRVVGVRLVAAARLGMKVLLGLDEDVTVRELRAVFGLPVL